MSNIKALKSIITSKGQFSYCNQEWNSGKKLLCRNGTEVNLKIPIINPDRLLFLAYAFLRGVPYRVVEASAGPLAESVGGWNASFITKAIAYVVTDHGGETDPGEIQTWLEEPETETRATKRRTAEARSRVEREARKAAHTAAMRAKYVSQPTSIAV